jgi:hypothetical protein
VKRLSTVVAIAAALTVAWAAQTPASHKQEWVVSSTPIMKGHTQHYPLDVECVPAGDELAEPIYVRANYSRLHEGDPCPFRS